MKEDKGVSESTNKVAELWSNKHSVLQIADKLDLTIPEVIKQLQKVGYMIPRKLNKNHE